MMEKTEVVGDSAHNLFKYLKANSLPEEDISWNFWKYLVNAETGQVI